MTSRRISEWKRWGGTASKAAACAVGAGLAVPVILVGALSASLFAVAVALLRTGRAASPPAEAGRRDQRVLHHGAASRLRATALQRAAADEAAR